MKDRAIGLTRRMISPGGGNDAGDAVHMSADLCLRFLRGCRRLDQSGLKSFGVFVGDLEEGEGAFTPTDVIFLDPTRNRRNDPEHRSAFEAQGQYFRRYDDAGWVADPAETLAVFRRVEASGLQIVA